MNKELVFNDNNYINESICNEDPKGGFLFLCMMIMVRIVYCATGYIVVRCCNLLAVGSYKNSTVYHPSGLLKPISSSNYLTKK